MFDAILTATTKFFAAIPFTGPTWFVIAILAFFTWLFVKGDRDPQNPIKWEHLIIDSENNRTSPYKLGFLIGMIVSTWIVVGMADGDKLTFDIFGLYLTYLMGGAGMNTFFKTKTAVQETAQPQVPQPELEVDSSGKIK